MDNDAKSKNVLLVDDEIDICDFLSEYVQQKNIQSFYATDIDSALTTARNNSIGVVFLDNNLLSNVKGVEYIPQFKEINEDCKVYMLTANTKPEVKERANVLGADGFIEKPFDFETLDEVLENLHQNKKEKK